MMDTQRKSPEIQLTQSVLKALDILEYLQEEGKSVLPTQIASAIGVSRPTAYRLLATIESRDWVMKDAQRPGAYRLGYRILQMAGACLRHTDILRIARPYMEDMSRRYDENVSLFLLDDTEVVHIERVPSSKPLQPFSPLGARGVMHSRAVGKAILAFLPEREMERIVRIRGLEARTSRTITDFDQLKKELENVRRRGFSMTDNEDIEGLRAVAAPIFDFRGSPVAGLAVSGLAIYMSENRMFVLGEAVRDEAAEISRQLGYEEQQRTGPEHCGEHKTAGTEA